MRNIQELVDATIEQDIEKNRGSSESRGKSK